MDVLSAAFTAAKTLRIVDAEEWGACARCLAFDVPLMPTRSAVSKVFTAFDGWRDPSGRGLCPACAWAYRTKALRLSPYLVTTKPKLVKLAGGQLYGQLQRPLPGVSALVVPLHPGRKHLLPDAQWGRITVDDASLTWTPADVTRLRTLRKLRLLGFGPRLLVAPAPQWQVLRQLAPAQRLRVQQEWPSLNTWRRSRLWFDLAMLATSPMAAAA